MINSGTRFKKLGEMESGWVRRYISYRGGGCRKNHEFWGIGGVARIRGFRVMGWQLNDGRGRPAWYEAMRYGMG